MLAAGASAEPYVAKEFPPKQGDPKAIGGFVFGAKDIRILGKTGKDNEFTVYFQHGSGGRSKAEC